ncbi:MAG TPA: hypothetical protein PK055_06945 [Gammaproteobacteria bacterium]|nr:hypothetical protein [Xanthomonadales bacterium]MCB1594550.1 hypothetical protein [Xanthomonadales bacterium]HOP21780.1 hypothetical protein [Gammaproteobacteria bacterium]HPI95201.1 hypothetical protein [Gammaproteobacteria bacterium]HPQ87377.1 hypothetical protein [Gammaproteobacteria bacterium]
MKLKQLVILSLVIVLTACGESGTPRERVESNLSKLVKACSDKGGDYSGAAGLVVYNGSDRNRKYKDLASAEGDDRSILNSTCYRISNLMNGKNSYTLMKFEEEPESEGTWYIQTVKFDGNKTAQLAFLDIKGTMGLGDID